MEENQEINNEKNPNIERLISQIIQIREGTQNEEEEKISNTAVVGKLAFFYEKIRNTVEYREEHLILKSAIERLLRRKFPSYIKGAELGEEIVKDLITGGYIDDSFVTRSTVKKIDFVLDRFCELGQVLGRKIKRDLISFIACGIEECLRKEVLEKEALVSFVILDIKDSIKTDIPVDEDTFLKELYIAVHQTLIKSDYPTVRYRLLKTQIPQLDDPNIGVHDISVLVEQKNAEIDTLFGSPNRARILRLVRKIMPAYSIIGKMIAQQAAESLEGIFADKEELRHKVDVVYSKWRERAYEKISRTAIRSVLFIFLTKMVLALVLELPYELLVLQRLNFLALGLNLIFPPLYMFISTYNIKVPGRENLTAIQHKIARIAHNQKDEYQVKLRKTGSLKKSLFFFIYLTTFGISFGFLTYILFILDFSIVAGILFFVFFSTVSFFAYRISQIPKDLTMVKPKGTIREVIVDFFSLPFIKLGQFLSSSFSRVNIFLFFMDFIIETPFKTLIKFIDEWVSYAREKKEDILNE